MQVKISFLSFRGYFYVYFTYLSGMKGFYHLCSKGFGSEILFRSEEEFIAGINRIAVCVALSLKLGRPVVVLAFCLMDNHFHFILFGSEEDCLLFAANYKKLSAMWVSVHRGHPLSEDINLGKWPVPPYKLGEKIVYVLRNPVAAKMRVTPQGYRWSSAYLMFSDWKPAAAVRVSDCSKRELKRILSSNESIPEDWLIENGMVLPMSFVDVAAAEKAFTSIGSFMFSLNDSKIDKETEEEMAAEVFSLPDSEVRLRAVELVVECFRKPRISSCSAEERLRVARILRKELSCNAKQLARVLHLDPGEIQRLV